MKRILLITTVFLLRAGVQHAQSIPFPANKAVWKEEHQTFIGPVFHHFGICGDTLIDGVTYGQVFDFGTDSTGAIIGGSYMGGIRSGGSVVRFLQANTVAEYTLYDFSLMVGQTVQLQTMYSDLVTRTVDSVTTEIIAGQPRKVIYFKPMNGGFPLEFWMEGIGSNFGLLGRAQEPGGDFGFTLLCFEHENIYLNLTLIECFLPALPDCKVTSSSEETSVSKTLRVHPNPASEELHLGLDAGGGSSIWRVDFFDTSGRLVHSAEINASSSASLNVGHFQKGFYILSAENRDAKGIYWWGKLVIH